WHNLVLVIMVVLIMGVLSIDWIIADKDQSVAPSSVSPRQMRQIWALPVFHAAGRQRGQTASLHCLSVSETARRLRIGLADPGIPDDRSRRIAARRGPRRTADDNDFAAAATDAVKLLERASGGRLTQRGQ